MPNPEDNYPENYEESQRTSQIYKEREEVLSSLLGVDYEFAMESGLLDMFYFNPDNGEDSLLHILTGDVTYSDSENTITPGGFHHEPSSQTPQTFIDRSHIEGRNSKESRRYEELPYNPYLAHVVIGGLKKVGLGRPSKTGERKVHSIDNGMFPNEYDALAVIQAIKIAYDGIDSDEIVERGDLLVVDSVAPLLDGKSSMKVRMFLDKDTSKIISAFPVSADKVKMTLSDQDKRIHLGLE